MKERTVAGAWRAYVRDLPVLTAISAVMYASATLIMAVGVLFYTEGKNPRWVLALLTVLAAAFTVYVLARRERFSVPEATWMVGVQVACIALLTAGTGLDIGALSNGMILPVVGAYVVWCLPGRTPRVVFLAGVALWFVAIVLRHESSLVVLGVAIVAQSVVATEVFGRMKRRLEGMAHTDELTGVLNRRGLMEAAERFILLAKRKEFPLAVVAIDLDDLRKVNNSSGHHAGDLLLARISAHWRDRVRTRDLIGRVGGDEFVILLPDTDLQEAERVVTRLAEDSPCSWSAGVAMLKEHDTLVTMLERADQRMYLRKAQRRAESPAARTRP